MSFNCGCKNVKVKSKSGCPRLGLHYEVIKTHHKRVDDLYWQKGKLDDSNYYKATDLKGLLK